MINMPLSKCLLAALSVLSCVDAVAPSTTPDVAFDATAKIDPEMRGGRALGTAPAPSPKDCTELNNQNTCTAEDKRRVTRKCSDKKPNQRLCKKMCRKRYKKLSESCKEACCSSSPSPSLSPPPSPPAPSPSAPPCTVAMLKQRPAGDKSWPIACSDTTLGTSDTELDLSGAHLSYGNFEDATFNAAGAVRLFSSVQFMLAKNLGKPTRHVHRD